MTSKLIKLAACALLLLLFAGAAAAADDTTTITPTATLTFENIPEGIINGAEVTIDASAEITEEMKTILRQQKITITNIAYAVAITTKGFDKAEVRTTQVSLPAAKKWVEENPRAAIVTISDGSVNILYAEEWWNGNNPFYEATMVGLPDTILLVATDSTAEKPTETEKPTQTNTPTQTATQTETTVSTPAPIIGILAALAVVCLRTRRA